MHKCQAFICVDGVTTAITIQYFSLATTAARVSIGNGHSIDQLIMQSIYTFEHHVNGLAMDAIGFERFSAHSSVRRANQSVGRGRACNNDEFNRRC